jgi:ketosteroid isomerase-like protein
MSASKAARRVTMTLRATHIYRRIDSDWMLVHRHADFPSAAPPKVFA